MSDEQLPPDEANVNDVNLQLQDGIRNCRSMVASYRTLLAGTDGEAFSNDNDPAEGKPLPGIDER